MKKLFTCLILMIFSFYIKAENFTVTTKADDLSSGSFHEIFNTARNYGANNTIIFANNVDTVFISRTYIQREVLSNLIIDGQRADGSKVVFSFADDYYWHLFGNSHVQLKNIEFTNSAPCDPRTFNLQSDNSAIKTSAMLSADFSASGQLTVDNCIFNYLQSEYFSQGGALICFGDDNVVVNSKFSFADFYAFAEEYSAVQPKGGLLYMQGSMLDNCEFSGASVLMGEQIQLTGGIAYCRVDSIKNCTFKKTRIEMHTPDLAQGYAPNMEITGGILYAENAVIVNCEFNDNSIFSSLHDAQNNATECMIAKGGIVCATQYSEIKSCKINNNNIKLKVYDYDYPHDATKAKSYSTIKGGALYFTGGHPITKTYIQNNRVEAKRNSFGAGVYLDNATINTSLISDNQAIHLGYSNGTNLVYDTDGFVGGGIYATADSRIQFSTIVNNNSQNGDITTYNKGGGIASATNNDVSVWGCILWRNSFNAGITGEYDTYPMPNNMQYSASMGVSPSGKNNIQLSWANNGENTTTLNFVNFIDPENGNYKIGNGSACIDKVWEASYPTDIMGRDKRNKATGSAAGWVDCGAYEFYYGSSYQGGTIYVTENGTGYGSSWEDATSDLNGALKALNSSYINKPSEVWVAKGTYHPSENDIDEKFTVYKNTSLYGGFLGNETSREQRDYENNETILSGNLPTENNSKVVVVGQSVDGVIDGFTIKGASKTALSSAKRVSNCKISKNDVSEKLVNITNATIENCHFFSNTLSLEYIHSTILLSNDTVHNVSIYNNVINITTGSNRQFYGPLCQIKWDDGYAHNLKVYNNTINCSVDDALSYFSAIVICKGEQLAISNNIINLKRGESEDCPVVYKFIESGEIINSTICGNTLNIDENFTDVSALTATQGLAVDKAFNTVLWNNKVVSTEAINYNEITVPFSGEISIASCAYQGNVNRPSVLENCIKLEDENSGSDATKNYPSFSDPDNGEYWLRLTSALVDVGANEYVGDITTDIEGNARIYNSTVDIGAYEYKPYVIPDANGIVYIKKDGEGNGSSWENAASSLVRALPVGGIQQVWVAAGTYYPSDTENRNKSFVIPNGIKIYGGFAGTETSIDERDFENNETILSGNRKSYRVVFVKEGADENTIIDGFTITQGQADDIVKSDIELKGVGIYNNGATVSNCNIIDNNAAIVNTFLGQPKGIGVYNNGGIIENCRISANGIEPFCGFKNDNFSINGSGIYSENGKVSNCEIASNYCKVSPSSVSFDYVFCSGIGAYIVSGDIDNCKINQNYIDIGNGSNFMGVIRPSGAGIYLDGSTSQNCLIYENTINVEETGSSDSQVKGAGALIYNSELINTTLVNNEIETIIPDVQGDALFCLNSNVKNTIVYDDRANALRQYDLVYDRNSNSEFTYTAVKDALFSGVGNINLAENNTGSESDLSYVAFSDIDNNDFTLLEESACVNAGNNSFVTTTYDLAGNQRINGANVDMGCYERISYTLSGTITGANDVTINITGDLTELYNISDGESYSLTIDEGTSVVITPNKNNYRFNPVNYELTNINADNTALDFAAIRVYSVVFKDWDGTELLAAQQVDHGSAATAPANNPTRVAYTFTGWDVDFSNITSDLTVTAQYSPISYSITYNLDGGTNDASNPSNYSIETETITLVAASKANYTFQGWYTESNFANGITEITNGSMGDISLYAKWAINTYEVTFVDWNGTELLATQKVNHGAAATAPANDPIRKGYTFIGWDVDYSNVTSDLTVTAQYSPISYSITYNLDGGTNNASNPENYTIETETITLANATKANHSFEGWYSEATFINQITEIANGSNGDMVLFAQWTINTYTVTFIDWDGSELKQEIVEYGAGATAPSNPTRAGYTFIGWDVDFSSIIKDLTVTAQYEQNGVNNYTVTFTDWDNTVLKNQIVAEGNSATAPSDPIREGYLFTGWDVDFENVTKDLTITAQYEIVNYIITYNLDGGTNDNSNPSSYNVETETITLADATKGNHSFEGWYRESSFTNKITEIAKGSIGDLDLFAKWLINTYTVTFIDWDGAELKQEIVEYGVGATAPSNPTRAGYTFIGWDVDFSSITTDLTVTAQYEQNGVNNYTVLFTDWDNTVLKTQIVAEGNSATAPSDPIREGYVFTGWDIDFSNVTTNLIVRAQYSIINYTISYYLDGGTNSTSNPDIYTIETSDIVLASAEKDGYRFIGWFIDEDFSSQISAINKGTTGEINLYAKWDISNAVDIIPTMELGLYPNPVKTSLTIIINNLKQDTDHYITIYSISGRMVYKEKISDADFLYQSKLQIDASQWERGLYVVRVGGVIKKIIKE